MSLVQPWLAIACAALLISCAEKTPGTPQSVTPAPAAKEKPQGPPITKPLHASRRAEVSSIGLEELFALQQEGRAMIFDVRPAVFHAMGHIPGAISLPKNGCDEVILARGDEIRTALAAGKTLVVYCSGLLCPDARAVAMRLAGYGHPARIFSGGWDAWRDAGMPTE